MPHIPAAAALPALPRIAIIVVVTLVTYIPAYRGDWLWDDDGMLTENPTVQSGSLAGLVDLWVNPDGLDYFPLSYTALWMQWPLFGKNPTGYHVTSVLLHISSALLLWRLLDRMRIPGGWLAGLLFAVHPVCVESVAWIAEIKNTLSLPLFLLAAISWVEQDEATSNATRLRPYALSLACFLLSLLAKPTAVAFPVITLLHAWWKRGTISRQDVIRSLPLFAISLALGLITVSYQHGRGIGEERMPIGGAAARIATAGMATLFYLATVLWPVNLLPNYPRWEVDPPRAWQLLAWLPIGAACACGWVCRDAKHPPRWGRHLIFGLGFFLLAVLPVAGFIPMTYMRIAWVADHFIYLPMIGIVALACAVAADGHRRSQPAVRRALECGVVLVVCLCAALAYRHAGVFADEDTLWEYTLARNPDAWMAHNRLGSRKFNRGDQPGALGHFSEAARIRPDLRINRTNLGLVLSALGRHDEALREYAEAYRVATPSMKPDASANLGVELIKSGRPADAERIFRDLATRFPGNHEYVNNWAAALLRMGDRETAIRQWRRVLELKPDFEPARKGLARALRENTAAGSP